jgi:hypothetical protein
MWNRGVTVAATVALVLARAGDAQGLEASPHGSGTFEARIQTPTNAAAELLSLWNAPGFFYDPESGDYLLNLIAGGGYFVSDGFAVGVDLGYQRANVDDEKLWYATVAPFLKVVTGLDEGNAGFFAEASPGMLFTNDRLIGRSRHFLLGGWLGLHLPIGRSLSVMMGPSVVGASNVGSNGGFPAVVGLRFGMSLYLSGPEKPAVAKTPVAKSKLPPFELRLHTASHVAGGGGVLGAGAGRGAFYATRSRTWVSNVTGGGGVFMKPWLGLGLDFAENHAFGGFEWDSYTLSPFVKFVSGMESRSLGVFGEASTGLVLARVRDFESDNPFPTYDRYAGLLLGAWVGAHVPVGRSAAFLAGPTAGWLEDLGRFGDRGSGYLGFRFGMSAFVP